MHPAAILELCAGWHTHPAPNPCWNTPFSCPQRELGSSLSTEWDELMIFSGVDSLNSFIQRPGSGLLPSPNVLPQSCGKQVWVPGTWGTWAVQLTFTISPYFFLGIYKGSGPVCFTEMVSTSPSWECCPFTSQGQCAVTPLEIHILNQLNLSNLPELAEEPVSCFMFGTLGKCQCRVTCWAKKTDISSGAEVAAGAFQGATHSCSPASSLVMWK